jgi:hypothetical protein
MTPKRNPSMSAKADLEKRVEKLKDRIQKAGEDGERPLPPDKVRTFRKRLKRTQRKIAKGMAKEEKAAKAKPAEAKPADQKPAEATATEEKPADEKPAEESPAEEKAAEEEASEEKPEG